MVNCNVIMGMERLDSCYAAVDCRTKRVYFHFPRETVREWRGGIDVPKVKIISYHKSKGIISKGYICHLVE